MKLKKYSSYQQYQQPSTISQLLEQQPQSQQGQQPQFHFQFIKANLVASGLKKPNNIDIGLEGETEILKKTFNKSEQQVNHKNTKNPSQRNLVAVKKKQSKRLLKTRKYHYCKCKSSCIKTKCYCHQKRIKCKNGCKCVPKNHPCKNNISYD